MNPLNLQRRILRLTYALVAAGSIFITACGGSSSSTETAGIGGTGIVVGKITGFGSVLVNGGTFDIDTSQFNVDGNTSANQGDLALGMVIQLQVETSNGAFTNKAVEVIYDDEIEGPVTNLMTPNPLEPSIKTGTIFGQTIIFDDTSTVFDNTSFAGMVNGNVIEVSGFRVSPSQVKATYVEKKSDSVTFGSTEIELRGIIGSYVAGPPETFVLDGVTVNTDAFTEIEVSGSLQDGIYVEAKGILQTANSMLATKIEEEDEDFDEDIDDISLQGIVVDYNRVDDFIIGNQPVDASTAEFKPASLEGMDLQGMNVEVEGEIVGGTLIAEEVETREGETELKSFVSFVYPDNIRFEVNYTGLPGSILVNTSGQTLFVDEGPLQLPNFSVADLIVGDYVIVEGTESGNEVTADTVKRKDSADPDDSKLEGQVDAFVDVPVPTSITVLGITFAVDGSTDYEDATGIVSSAVFFNQLQVDDIVEIKDEEPADGIADEVELE